MGRPLGSLTRPPRAGRFEGLSGRADQAEQIADRPQDRVAGTARLHTAGLVKLPGAGRKVRRPDQEATVEAQFTPDFAKADGLITCVTVDASDGEVLMVAYMNAEAFKLTLETGKVHYWSRSRNKLWKKGESSGNMQQLVEMRIDCDLDAVVVRVEQSGPACHEGYKSCFFRTVDADGALAVNSEQLMTPEQMYGGSK
ncbi:MAG: phosphoribosyl-AMP cyclohydrolase [Brooklawnia sp.]|nr:phosphoribosyl-AMP cyclohydrolase [Brooklawnia sp.]